MAELTANKLLDLIKRSGLIEEGRLKAFLEKETANAGGTLTDDQKALADRMIEADLLTQWQADKLLAGKHKGFRLGKYKLLGQIGKGGMSSVYLAEHVMMRRKVAIKVLPQSRVKDSSYLERFQLEARAVARLDDPNIVRAFDIDNDGNIHYIVMEYVKGQDLHQVVAEHGALDYETAADYVAQAANGLQHAHEMGLIHRDIKPANCLLDKHQTVKILDMGLAKLANDEETSLTLANEENVLGTADYLAPEQALNSHEADVRSDVYSLGCTLYFLLVGRPPFPEGTISERLLKHQVEEPEPILNFRPDAPLSLLEICAKMMAKKAIDRYQTAGDVAAKLTEWLAKRGRKLGGGQITSSDDEGSGVGSGILSRFSVAPPPPSSPLSSGGGSDNLSSPGRDTAKLSGPDTDPDEDIGLAPLDEDDSLPKAKSQPSKPAAKSGKGDSKKHNTSSDVLSVHLPAGSSKGSGGKAKKPSSKPGSSTQSGKPAPKKTLFEEEFSEDENDPVLRRAREKATLQYDPLHPPGYSGRSGGPHWSVFVIGAVVLLGVFFLVISLMT